MYFQNNFNSLEIVKINMKLHYRELREVEGASKEIPG
jgi:hypothetical protein